MNILLLGANERAAYSYAKSFHRRGDVVTVLHDSMHAIRHSRFVKKFICIRHSFERQTQLALLDIVDDCKRGNYDVIIPVNDLTLSICYEFYPSLSPLGRILFINEKQVHRYCSDKSALLEKCAELGIPTPVSILIRELKDLDKIAGVKYPCILKPVSSKVYDRGKIFSYTVKKVNSEEELIDFVREKIETLPVMVQEILPDGFGVGYNFLSVNGTIQNAYAHQRINEAWGGGQSTYRKTIAPGTYNLEAYSKKLVEAIGWTGIAMIEYRVVNGKPYIMEINGRGWGSIELGIFAGCDLPSDMLQLLYHNQPVQPFQFRQSVYARNLFNEFNWILQSKSPVKLVKWMLSLVKVFRKDHVVEDSLFTDFWFRLNYAGDEADKQLAKLAAAIRMKLFPPVVQMATRSLTGPDKRIAFICKGNINRSAFAEKYVNTRYPGYQVSGYGTVFEEERLSPVKAVEVAASLGVSLGDHRSRYLTSEDIAHTDIFIIMDRINYADLRKMGVPHARIFLLDKEPVQDPYGKTTDGYRRSFEQICQRIDALFGA